MRHLAAVPFLLLFLAHCRPESVEDRVAKLPELPPEIAATLDPERLATKVASGAEPPETPPKALLLPCCSSKETRRLKVRFRYTKCSLPAHFFDLVLTQDGSGSARPQMHKLTELRGRNLALTHFCRSSDGPWDAVLTETRACSPPAPSRTLVISAFGDAVLFAWGGPQSPPANVQVVACREESDIRSPCGISGCTCSSTTCAAGQECPCSLELPGPSS
ncbi:MAG TPA: hypothetical protein VF121_09100 [Thermoanaerobaculia bacterium]|nr:hypothetical protein [Thermoanaerobaculia bacterium]